MNDKEEIYWEEFTKWAGLNSEQEAMFKKYYELLVDWNEKFNLTAITSLKSIINYHFKDSLYISNFVDFKKNKMTCDIGTGAGFPGIPLKIMFPSLSLVLIEVNNKKIKFLNILIERLELNDVIVYPLDWRTFLRKTNYPIDLFFARASLSTKELLRLFKPGCTYKDSKLIYFASIDWEPTIEDKKFLLKEELYSVGSKKRKYIFFQ